ncbi:MAG: M20/M25/M40 family metallo-hydrolase [Armatimonadota bacterium]|nr:M20/M25/M40 family metallo-hydrolase [Armatimonadota bacterium]MCX7777614.1 M20/M25/M40 family metallo-hydrolase [Armatimonadota bacterium]MDW8024708.1 M20/M25/M40 family metallo-hydrolase [Armatimonadota bacterium]
MHLSWRKPFSALLATAYALSLVLIICKLGAQNQQSQPLVDKSKLRETFLALVQIDSGSENEDVIGEWVAKRLRQWTDDVEIDEAWRKIGGRGGNVIARFKGDARFPTVLLNAHLDTVLPTVGIKVIEDGDIIRTDGRTILGADDKAGVAIILEVLSVLHKFNFRHPPIEVVFTVREEKGLLGAKALDMSKLRAKYGLVIDGLSDPSTIITSMPSHDTFEVSVSGKAAHAGLSPEQGVNAIVVAARAISRLQWGRLDKDTTCNVGIISGGRATNVVADSCTVCGEMRSHSTKRLDELRKQISWAFEEEAKAMGASVNVKFKRLYSGFSTRHDSPVVLAAINALRQMGIEAQLRSIEAGSDASVFSESGIECIVLPTGASNIHTVNEFVNLSNMQLCAELLLRTLINLAPPK